MSAELAAVDWLGRGWLLILAFTAAVLCVALLRRPCRRLFGAEGSFVLWLLPPLAMLASAAPHAPAAADGAFSSVVLVIAAAVDTRTHAQATGLDGRAAIGWVWLAGTLASMACAAWAQASYRRRLRHAVPWAGIALAWPVLRAASVDLGPALVGAWRPRIVVPADFEQRYGDDERALILAHEAMHARRHDGWWCLLAQACLSLLWFHPLAWWACGALRHDQELACDAAVLRAHAGCRRRYAQAMLKTPTAMQALPIGCSWSSRHPLTERIAMLKCSLSSLRRRRAGLLAGLTLAALFTGAVYAATAPAAATAVKASTSAEYQLDMQLSLFGDNPKASHAQTVKLALCMAPGEPADFVMHGMRVDATTRPLADQRVGIDLAVRGEPSGKPAHTQLQGTIGQRLQAAGALAGKASTYVVEVTPRLGCPARDSADAAVRYAPVNERVRNGTAGAVAASIASQAHLVLANPQALGSGPITLEFHDVPADRALRLVADIAGSRAVIEGARVRFEPK